jgi:Spy/CpxP family protein refolding chaperone
MSRKTMFAALLAVVMAAPVMAQEASKPQDSNSNRSGDSNRGDRGGDRGGGFDRGRFTDMIKERMGVTDEEWKVIEPKFTKVSDLRREQMGGMFGRGGRGGDNSSENRSAMQTASRELRDLLENKDASAEQIQAKLKAFREARDEAKKKLVAAQAELKEVLTQRQEAALVSMGMLD